MSALSAPGATTGPPRRGADGPGSTRRFVRWIGVGLVLTVLVLGVGGLTAIRLSTSRSGTVAEVVDPALVANAHARQAVDDARAERLVAQLPSKDTADASASTSANSSASTSADPVDRVAVQSNYLDAIARATSAGQRSPAVRRLLAAEAKAAQDWIDRPELDGSAYDGFRVANDAVTDELSRERHQLMAHADRLRNLAAFAFGLLVLAGLGAMVTAGGLATRFLVTPQRVLVDVVERLRLGEQNARVPIDTGSAEVRGIAVALNGLADEVQAWRSAQDETERLRRTSVDISRTVREELNIEAVLRAVPMIGPALHANRSWLRLVRGEGFGPVVREWASEGVEPVGGEIPMAGEDPFHLAQQLWRRGEVFTLPYLTDDIDLGQRGLGGFVAVTGARSLLVVPVGAGEQLLGLLGLAMTDGPRGWTAEEVSWAQRVAADLGRAIEHAQLFAQQRELVDKLRDLDRRKDDFLSTVSHELRTPLTSIMGYLEIVRDGEAGEVPAQMARMLDVVDRNAVRLRALIDDLLLLSRIEEGSLDVGDGQVDVARLVTQAAETVRPQAEAGGVALDVYAGPEGLTVAGDARHLEMMALNVLSNAVKFTPHGGRVSLNVRHDVAAGELLLTCADSGIGIPEQDQAGMFGRFFRGSNAAASAIPGTGLGLSVIKGIVEAHGGAVALTSREGKGTIVSIRLPGAQSGGDPAPAAATERGNVPTPVGGSPTVR